MTDERRPDETPIENPVDNPIDNPSKPAPESNQPTDPKPHSVPKPKKEAPAWLQAIGGFFKALFVTPWALMQKVFLRIAGGKKMVEEAEKQLVEDLKEQKVRQAESERASFLEREINDLLKERMQDPAYTADGLAVTKVTVSPNVTGDDSILHSITVTCQNGDKDGGEYQIHMGRDGMLRYNAIVPPELQLQLQELIKSANLTTGDTQVGDHEEPFDEESISPPDPQALVQAHTVRNDLNGIDVTVTRSKDKAVVEIAGPKGESHECTATLVGGHIHVDGLPQNIASNAVVSQTIYQAFQPLLHHNLTVTGPAAGFSLELMQQRTLEGAFMDMRASVCNNLSADAASIKKSTSMFIVPSADGHVTVINENISPNNQRGDRIHLNAYQLDITNPTNFQFQQGTVLNRNTKEEEQGTIITHQAFYLTQAEPAWNTHLAQFYYAATNLGVMPTHPHEQFIAFGDQTAIARTSDLRLVTCVQAVTQEDGFELRSETHLNNTQLQELTNMLHRDDAPTTFSTETRAAAAEVLSQAVQFKQQGEKFTRYFVMGDTVMSYDGSTLTMQRPSADKPFTYATDKLDADIIETAYSEYSSQNRNEHEQPSTDEVETSL